MFKAIILLTRKEGMTPDEFRRWWLDEHAPLARQLPGVRRIVGNLVTTPDAPYDGITELWFDDQAALEGAYASEIGQAVAADSMAHVSGRVRLAVDEVTLVG
ncbi:MAG: EthD domain-containing protein [Gaiella sp.]